MNFTLTADLAPATERTSMRLTTDERECIRKALEATGPELVIDNFAGGGGASCGIEAAGLRVDYAINHDLEAVAMHAANHPATVHYTQNINTVDPREVTQGRPVGLAWFSPDCKHFSKAKGGKPVEKRIRDLAWVVVHWAKLVRPRVIILENVEEFTTWGPLLDDGRPCPVSRGLEFKRWCRDLRRLGYVVEHRELRACNYGAPTIRRRLFLVARCDGQAIVWPEPTHGPGLLPYRVAAECIDWGIPVRSIFERKRPLAPATCRRIARGIYRYVLEANPFIVPYAPRVHPINERAILAGCGGRAGQSRERGVDEPMATITAKGDTVLACPYFVPRYGERDGQEPRCQPPDEPLSTVVPTQNGASLCAAFLAQHNGGATGHRATEPVSTITQAGTQQQLVTAWLGILRNNCHSQDLRQPAPTVTAGGWHLAEVRAFLQTYYGTDQDTRLDAPLPTATTRDRFGVVTVAGVDYQIVDIGMRMLAPRELFRAQGFPEGYQIEVDYGGKPLTKTAQVRMCGNSVCPPLAEAMVRANVQLRTVAPKPAAPLGDLFAEVGA